LQEFQGSLILVSHDVDFLTPIVNKVVEIRKGEIKFFTGGIEYYLSKREEQLQQQQYDEKIQSDNSESVSKKNKKRIEAELRQKRYKATINLIKGVKDVENKIERLEKKVMELEQNLAAPEVYNNPAKARKMTLEFNSSKNELEQSISLWEKLSEELIEIEKQYDI